MEKKIFKKYMVSTISIILLIAIIMTCFVMPPIANADILIPISGLFFQLNIDDCNYEVRTYIADSVSGKADIFKSPTEHIVVGTLKNGEEFGVKYTYESNNVLWGGSDAGWIMLDNFGVVYDSIQFEKDNNADICDYEGELFSIPKAYAYTYPNSGECEEMLENENFSLLTESVLLSYKDENGNTWGKIGYYMGRREKYNWICISDPLNENLDGGIQDNLLSNAKISGKDTKAYKSVLPYIIAVSVLAIVGLSIYLIKKAKKKQ